MKKYITLILSLVTALVLVACGNNDAADTGTGGEEETTESTESTESATVTLAVSPGPYSELFLDEVAPRLEEQGFTVESEDFVDLLAANTGVQEGAADLNVDQHLLYMENFNNDTGAEFVSLTEIPTVPAAIFPGTKDDLENVSEGDRVGVPDDPSNLTRALLILEKVGWITLDDSKEPIDMTEDDIVENVHGIEIVPMASAGIPRSLPDLEYGVIPGSIAYDSGVPFSDALLLEDVLPELMLQAVVKSEDADTEWAQAVKEIYESGEFKETVSSINDERGEVYWLIPE